MGNLDHRETEVQAIIKRFNQLTYHPYLKDYIPEVGMDEAKCRLFYHALSKKADQKEAAVVTLCVMLVQAALDVHEEVSLQPIQSDLARKHRQLSVLIGDFYSSLYYYLLAEADQVPLTRIFSYTLQEINELKMDVYGTTSSNYEEMAEKLTYIDSALYGKMLEEYEIDHLKPVFQTVFFYHRFMLEWHKWELNQGSSLIQSMFSPSTEVTWEHIHQTYVQLSEQVEQLMHTHQEIAQEMKDYINLTVPPAPNSYIQGKAR